MIAEHLAVWWYIYVVRPIVQKHIQLWEAHVGVVEKQIKNKGFDHI
jgi:hypothetical protein